MSIMHYPRPVNLIKVMLSTLAPEMLRHRLLGDKLLIVQDQPIESCPLWRRQHPELH